MGCDEATRYLSTEIPRRRFVASCRMPAARLRGFYTVEASISERAAARVPVHAIGRRVRDPTATSNACAVPSTMASSPGLPAN